MSVKQTSYFSDDPTSINAITHSAMVAMSSNDVTVILSSKSPSCRKRDTSVVTRMADIPPILSLIPDPHVVEVGELNP